MNIVTTYFTVKRIPGSSFIGESSLRHCCERQQEYVDCLARNALHPQVRSILLLVEGIDGYHHFCQTFLGRGPAGGAVRPGKHLRKLVPILYSPTEYNTTDRPIPLYAELFQRANQLLPGELCMVCNADVHLSAEGFDVGRVQALFDRADSSPAPSRAPLALALTRRELDTAGLESAPLIRDYRGSHDAFVVRAPVPEAFLRRVAHQQNCYQAENIVIHALRESGFTVLNPCLDLRLIHRHTADVRQWLPSHDPSRYGRAEPATVADCLAALT